MKGHRTKKPFFKNRIENRKKKTQTNLLATSKKTGIQHTFGNLRGWEQVIEQYEQKAEMQKTQLVSSLHFYQWLEKQTIDKSLCVKGFTDPCYRFANPRYGPIAIAGSLAYGGRFNIGGSQMDSNFPTLNIFGCLYFTSSAACAKEEAAKPIGVHKLYKITPKKMLFLWDLAKVIQNLDYSNLFDLVRASHGEKIWAYQKIPTESQILGHKLKTLGCDGVLFESTKLEGHFNLGLFYDNDTQAQSDLTVQVV